MFQFWQGNQVVHFILLTPMKWNSLNEHKKTTLICGKNEPKGYSAFFAKEGIENEPLHEQ